MGMRIKFEGARELLDNLKKMDRKIALEVVKDAVAGAGDILVAKTKPLVPVSQEKDAGNLKRNIISKVSKHKRKNGYYSAIVGPRYSTTTAKGNKTAGANYGHNVENGHIARNGKFVPGKPFLRPAFMASANELMNYIAAVVRMGISR